MLKTVSKVGKVFSIFLFYTKIVELHNPTISIS